MKTGIEEVIKKLTNGEVGIFPTDTAFGIGCRMDKESSVRRVYTLRKRPRDKALLVLVSSVEMAKKYVNVDNDVKEKLIDKYWPGGLTIIFNCNVENVPDIVRARGKTLAVRLPDHAALKDVIENVGVPVVAPSANLSGEKTPYTVLEVDKKLIGQVDFILPGVCTMKGVSTIIDVTVKPWKIVRNGVVTLKNI